METLWLDVRYASRMLLKNRGATLVSVLTLALGIGANTAIFSIADAFLLRPVSLPSPESVAVIAIGDKAPAAAADYRDWRSQSRSFEQLAAYRTSDLNLTGIGEAQRVFGAKVSANFFAALSVSPMLGRSFAAGEDEPGRDQVIVLSHGIWQRQFGAGPGVLGTNIKVDGRPYTIAGVMGKDFNFPVPTDVWIPLALTPEQSAERAARTLHVFGPLKAGVSFAQAQAEMTAIADRLATAYPATNKDRRARVLPLREFVQGSITRSYTFMLLAVVGIVLLVACANVANLQFARATARRTELALRAALGASRLRIVRQWITESVLLSILGGAAGLLFAAALLRLCLENMPPYVARLIPGWDQIRLDPRSLSFTLVAGLLSGILAGLLPAFSASRLDTNEALKEGGRAATMGRGLRRLRSVVVIAQVGATLVLLAGAGLLVKGFRDMTGSAEAFAPEGVLTLQVSLPASRYPEPSARLAFYRKALDAFAALPGVRSAAAFSTFPMSNNGVFYGYFQVEGRPETDLRHSPWAEMHSVSPDYLRLMRIPLVAGRGFTPDDRENTRPVAIVGQKLAQLHWPNESAIGKRIRAGTPGETGPWLTVVGIAGDVLYDWTSHVPQPALYRPLTQAPPAASLLGIRVGASPNSYAAAARARIAAIDPELPPFDLKPLNDAIDESTVGLGYTSAMMGILGAIAFAISVVGVYGLMTYTVGERVHEFGIRIALGARRRDVLWLVSRYGLLLAAAGLAIGLPSAVVSARLLASLVYGTSPMDPATFLVVPTALLVAELAACYIPARRATRVNPVTALRRP